VAGYYGCTLLRPTEVAIEAPELPQMFDDFIRALGGEVAPFSAATECCSSYQILANEEAAIEASAKILKAAQEGQVEALAMSCPVCEYNLGRRQPDVREHAEGLAELPTFYFTQLLAVALGLPAEALGLKWNMEASAALLRDKNLLQGEAPASA
jgi:heterodisulfide reductase subunit B